MKWLIKRFFKPFAKGMLQALLGELADVAIVAVKEAAKMETCLLYTSDAADE